MLHKRKTSTTLQIKFNDMKKLKKHNELEVGKYYHIYEEDRREPYSIITDLVSEISYWRNAPSIKLHASEYSEGELYHEITPHSYNRIKRNVMRRLGLIENSNG